jgi:signal transduction histidine kinase
VAPVIQISASEVIGREAGANLQAEDAHKTYHLLQLQDNGIGFRKEDAENIFKAFTRLHGTSDYSGTGIGLSIVQRAAPVTARRSIFIYPLQVSQFLNV